MEFADSELEKEFPNPLTTSFSLVFLFAGNSNPILKKKKKNYYVAASGASVATRISRRAAFESIWT